VNRSTCTKEDKNQRNVHDCTWWKNREREERNEKRNVGWLRAQDVVEPGLERDMQAHETCKKTAGEHQLLKPIGQKKKKEVRQTENRCHSE
jgi:hypothetical protein